MSPVARASLPVVLAVAGACALFAPATRSDSPGARAAPPASGVGPAPAAPVLPRIEAVFTRPVPKDGTPGTGPQDTAIRDAVEGLLGSAIDVPFETDVHIAAYDWDQFWNGGPDARNPTGGGPRDGWPDAVCGDTFCCGGPGFTADCKASGHPCDRVEACGPASTAPYCKASWDPVAALVARGVEIKAIFNRGKSKAPVRDWLSNALSAASCRSADPDPDRYCGVRVCGRGMNARSCSPGGGCLDDGNMHVKMVLVRKSTRGSEHDVLVTSGNFDYDQLLRWNDALVVHDDAKLYRGLRTYYEAMWDGARQRAHRYADSLRPADGSIGPDGVVEGTSGIVTAYLFPRDEYDPRALPPGKGPEDVDVVVRLLDGVRSGTVLLVMAWFSNDRPQVVDVLTALRARGVNVKVILDPDVGEDVRGHKFTVDKGVVEALVQAGVVVRVAHVGIHHKMMLVSGDYRGAFERLVFTGSHNFTGPALRHNDEILLRVRECASPPCTGHGNGVFDRYVQQWVALCRLSARSGMGTGAGVNDAVDCVAP